MPCAEGDLSEQDSLQVKEVAELAATLADLHSKGIAHKDIKRDNFFLLGGKPLLADFGESVRAMNVEELIFALGCKADTRGFAVLAIYLLTSPEYRDSIAAGFRDSAPSFIKPVEYERAIDLLPVSAELKDVLKRVQPKNKETYPTMEELATALRTEALRV